MSSPRRFPGPPFSQPPASQVMSASAFWGSLSSCVPLIHTPSSVLLRSHPWDAATRNSGPFCSRCPSCRTCKLGLYVPSPAPSLSRPSGSWRPRVLSPFSHPPGCSVPVRPRRAPRTAAPFHASARCPSAACSGQGKSGTSAPGSSPPLFESSC